VCVCYDDDDEEDDVVHWRGLYTHRSAASAVSPVEVQVAANNRTPHEFSTIK